MNKLCLLVASLLAGASMAQPESQPANQAGDATQWGKVERANFGGGVSVTGRVIPQDGAMAVESARVSGRILSILKREGERVVKGTPLFLVSSGECSSLAAEKQVADSRGLKDLADGVAKREAELGIRLDRGSCFLVASEGGVISKRNVEAGGAFNPGDALATVLDVKRMMIELDVPEHDLNRVKTGQKARVSFASDPDKKIETAISTLLPAIDPATRAAKARLKPVPLPPGANLEALVFGQIETGQEAARLQVESSALTFFRNQLYVVKGPKENPKAVPIQVINENDKQSVIKPTKDGELKEGDLVAVKGGIFLLRKLMSVNLL